MRTSYIAASVAVLLAVAAFQPSQAEDAEALIKAKLVARSKAFAKQMITGHAAAEERGRSLAEHSSKSAYCELMDIELKCQQKSQADCTGSCAFTEGSCGSSDTAASATLLSENMGKMFVVMLTCAADDACTDSNCTKGDTCGATAAAVEGAMDDAVLGKIYGMQAACSVYNTAATCPADKGCSFSEGACGPSDAAAGNMAPMIMKECGITMADLTGGAATTSSFLAAAMAAVVVLGTYFVM